MAAATVSAVDITTGDSPVNIVNILKVSWRGSETYISKIYIYYIDWF